MTKKLFFYVLTFFSAIGMNAEVISPEEALARAGISSVSATRGMSSPVSPKLSFTKNTTKGDPAVYVFNGDERGFLVLSADDMAYPILGYSDSGRITDEDVAMNPALEWWLTEYARQIEYASSKGMAYSVNTYAIPSVRSGYQAIAPMIETSWDQGAPYNNQCPFYGMNRTYTGCVATAMAQVMNYWKYPEVGQGQIGYDASTIGKRLSLDFSKKKFDWDNMLSKYYGGYNEAQAAAVAYLMKACGYAVKMDYGSDSSGALALNIAGGLKKYFNYDPNILYTLRNYYSATQWIEMIYDNLKNVGPILYGGGSMLGGGHSFICDGYDGNGMFHFNWGWSGMSNGYFSLEALNPDALGTGGGAGGGYNFTQDAVFGIQPPTGRPQEERQTFMTQSGSLGAIIDSEYEGVLHFKLWAEQEAMWANYNGNALKLYFGAIFEPQGTTPGEVMKIPVSDVKFTIQPGYGTAPEYFDPKVDLKEAGLSDGVYKVTIATFAADEENPEWVPVKPYFSYREYVTLKKKGNDYEVVVDNVPGLEIEDAQIVGRFVYGCPITVRAKIVNNSDIELTRGFAPAFAYQNAICFLGESVKVTVPPHSSVEKEWKTVIYEMQGAPSISTQIPVYFTFLDESTYNLYAEDFIKEVYIEPNPGVPSINYGNAAPEIAGLTKVIENDNGVRREVYVLNEKDDRIIDIRADLVLRGGFFNYPVYGLLLSPAVDDAGNDRMMVEEYNGRIMFLSPGTKAEFSTSLNLSTCVPDVLYSIAIGYSYMSDIVPINGPWAYLRIVHDNTGVEGLRPDVEGLKISFDQSSKTVTVESASGIKEIDAYDMQGRKLRSVADCDSVSLEGLDGLMIIHALDRDGNKATVKVNL